METPEAEAAWRGLLSLQILADGRPAMSDEQWAMERWAEMMDGGWWMVEGNG